MLNNLRKFETIVRRVSQFTEAPARASARDHPFETRNIHADFPTQVKKLFDDGHYPQATFEAFKFIDEEVQRISKENTSGMKLMMKVFSSSAPTLVLNAGKTPAEKDEQEGYRFLFAGSMMGIRNPRGHSTAIVDDPDTCLDQVSFASMLLRRLDDAGLR